MKEPRLAIFQCERSLRMRQSWEPTKKSLTVLSGGATRSSSITTPDEWFANAIRRHHQTYLKGVSTHALFGLSSLPAGRSLGKIVQGLVRPHQVAIRCQGYSPRSTTPPTPLRNISVNPAIHQAPKSAVDSPPRLLFVPYPPLTHYSETRSMQFSPSDKSCFFSSPDVGK